MNKGTRGTGKRCFVVSAFGESTEEQKRYKQVLRHLVQKVLAPRYEVIRADEIDDEGLITNQIIEHLLDDDLVVADLTDLNPNVFYEVAVRHAARKPIIHLITRGQEIPFDIANMRAIQYALDDPDALEEAQAELERKAQAIADHGWKAAANPISAARDVWLLRESEQPEVRQKGELLAAVSELRDEVRSLARRVPSRRSPDGVTIDDEVLMILGEVGTIQINELAERLNANPRVVTRTLKRLQDRNLVLRIAPGEWAHPLSAS